VSLATVKATLSPEVADVGFKQAMQQKWVALDKSGGEPRIVRKVRG
jgi:phenylalanyl-tRNA synthetase alpha chain